MRKIAINCDLGERGVGHPIDDSIIPLVDMVNLACGGHAGDRESVKYYLNLSKQYQVEVSAHLSFPDKENFGRKYLDIPWSQLKQSLQEQLSLLEGSEVIWCKPHGALYHAVHQDSSLAENILNLLLGEGFQGVIGMEVGCWKALAEKKGIKFRHEAFAERKYILKEQRALLSSRNYSWSSISELSEALKQALLIIHHQRVRAVKTFSEATCFEEIEVGILADTLCVHSDSEIALDLCRSIREAHK